MRMLNIKKQKAQEQLRFIDNKNIMIILSHSIILHEKLDIGFIQRLLHNGYRWI